MKHILCSATKADGAPCRSVVSPGKQRCHYHWDFDLRARRRLRALRPRTIYLGSLADRHSILRALNRVLAAIASGSLPLDHCDMLLQRIRAASDSLPR